MPSRTVLISTAVVIGLLVGFGATYAVTSSQISSLESSLKQANERNSMLQQEMLNTTQALSLKPEPGQTFTSGMIFITPVGSGEYAMTAHAEGLKPPSAGAYIVEGVARGTMKMVPIGANATASEFEANTNGVGNFWTLLMQNPSASFEGFDLLFLPGMDMTHATLVATAHFG